MIKITKDGTYMDGNKPKHFKCRSCGCEFYATKPDYKYNLITGVWKAFCPQCKSKVKRYPSVTEDIRSVTEDR